MISVKQASKSFGSVTALQDISFEVKRGEVIGILGPNGAGKTTLMRLLTGFFPPSTGTILMDGKDLIKAGPAFRKRIGYLPENNPLYRDMTANDLLCFVAQLKGISFRTRKEEISKVVERCGLQSVLNRLVGKLSKGFQQRMGLAQALLGDPDVLILDEPTTGLDPKQIIEIRTLIQVLGKERTIVLSSHILPEVQMTCERVLILNQGRLIASGTSEDLESTLRQSEEMIVSVRGTFGEPDPFLTANLANVIGVRLERDMNGERDYRILCKRGKDARSEIARFVLDSGFELLSLKSAEWSLEEIFLKIVTRESKEAAECSKS